MAAGNEFGSGEGGSGENGAHKADYGHTDNLVGHEVNESRSRRCRKCQQEGHIKSDCANDAYCGLCSASSDHEASECPRARRQRYRDEPTLTHKLSNADQITIEEIKEMLEEAVPIRAWPWIDRAIKAWLIMDVSHTALTLGDLLSEIDGCDVVVKAVRFEPRVGDFLCDLDGEEAMYWVKMTVNREKAPFLLEKDTYPDDEAINFERLPDAGFIVGRDWAPCKCHVPGHPIDECPTDGKAEDEDDMCRNCGEHDHYTLLCGKPLQSACVGCKNTGHRLTECTDPKVGESFKRYKCWLCQSDTHSFKARACPKYFQQLGIAHQDCPVCHKADCVDFTCKKERAARVCRKCQQSGHMAKDCTVCRFCRSENDPESDTYHDEQSCPIKELTYYCKECNKRVEKAEPCEHFVCNKCKQPGHIAKDCAFCSNCFQEHRGRQCRFVDRRPCYRCGEATHRVTNCPQPDPKQGIQETAVERRARLAQAVAQAQAIADGQPPPDHVGVQW